MAQVPYTGTPSVEAQNVALPDVKVNAPDDAFGAGIARAISGLGKSMEGVGNELWGRAVAMQELRNETEADEANTEYTIKAGELHANYNALQGKDRALAFPKYQADLVEARTNLANGLSNPDVKRRYDRQSRSTMERSIFNGAGASASAQKEWTVGTAISTMSVDAKTVEDDPSNDGLFEEKVQRLKANVQKVADVKGFDDVQRDDLYQKQLSALVKGRIDGMTRKDAFKGAEMLKEAKANKTLIPTDLKVAENFVQAKTRSDGAQAIADLIWMGGQQTAERPAMSLKQMEDAARAEANNRFPDDPTVGVHAISALRTRFNQDKHATTIEKNTNQQIVLEAIQSGQNEQQILTNPVTSAAYQALPPTDPLKKSPLNYTVRQFTTKRDFEESEMNFLRLKGMAADPATVREFLDTNLPGEKLKPQDMRSLTDLRGKLIKNQNGDPRVMHYVGLMRSNLAGQLEDLGVMNRRDNPELYDQMTGAVSASLDAWTSTHGKAITEKEFLDTVAPQLIRKVAQERFFGIFPDKKVPAFQVNTSSKEFIDFSNKYIVNEKIRDPGKSDPPQAEIIRQYQNVQYQRLFGKKEPKQ